MKKYGFTGKTMFWKGHELKQIYALTEFWAGETLIPEGTVGGWIENEKNLPQKLGYSLGELYGSWIADNGKVYENGKVTDEALVYEDGEVFGNARIDGNGLVAGHGQVYGNARVGEIPLEYRKKYGLYEDSYCTPKVSGNAKVYDSAKVFGNYPCIYGKAEIYGKSVVFGESSSINGTAKVGGNVLLKGCCNISQGVYTEGEYINFVNIQPKKDSKKHLLRHVKQKGCNEMENTGR